MSESFETILAQVAKYYTEKVTIHGANAKGVDWNSPESQAVRFEQVLKVCDTHEPFSLNDYGCGYGALVEYMAAHGYDFKFFGFDISEEMITRAKELHRGFPNCNFSNDASHLGLADYTIASGIFNVKQQFDNQKWTEYVLHTLNHMAKLSQRGFSFNVLTKYSDPDRMRPDLYYGDPLFLFDYCKKKYSKRVALLHDYPLYEFTILVRME